MSEQKNIINYYNDFVEDQVDLGINERIYNLYKRLLGLGLNSGSTILELGCGVGTMTYLLSKKIKTGRIESVDFSTKSIEFATKKIQKSNIQFFAHDVVNYVPKLKNINFITLFDVIEHIPIENHLQLFNNLAKIANEDTIIAINIPSAEHVQYDIDNCPEKLQIIDQPISLAFMVENITKSNLSLQFFETYGIWVENDYQFLVITKKIKFNEIALQSKRSFFEKVFNKLKRIYIKLCYNYK